MPQRFYLRHLYAKRPVCSWIPEFAAYFRTAIPEVRFKTEIGRPDPGFTLPRPAVLLPKIRFCSEVFGFSPHFRNARPCKACSSNISGICDNIQLSQKRQRAVAGKPNNDPSLSSPHLESTTTASLATSYRNVKRPDRAAIGNADVHPNFHLNKTRGYPPLGRNPLAKRWPIAGFRFLFRTSYRSDCLQSGILKQANAQTSHHRFMPNIIQPLRPICNEE